MDMQRIFELVQNLQNLNRIKRQGGVLTLGLPEFANLSVAEHSYSVSYLAMLFCDLLNKKEINTEKVIRCCLTHDWQELVLGDMPSGSPSYGSFWGIDIRQEAEKAGKNIEKEMVKLVEGEIDLQKSIGVDLNELEKMVVKTADMVAYLLEIQEWKYMGFKHDGWEMIWFNTVDRLAKIDLPFISGLVTEIKKAYKEGIKRPSPFLAKKSKQVNPEHKL